MRQGDGIYERTIASAEGAIAYAKKFEHKLRYKRVLPENVERRQALEIIRELRCTAEALLEAVENL